MTPGSVQRNLTRNLRAQGSFGDLYMVFPSASRINVRCSACVIYIYELCIDGVEGYDVTIGLTAWANNPLKKDAFVCSNMPFVSSRIHRSSQLVAQFKAAGAIIIVKTNVPQTMLAFECSNPLWGCSTNPWNDQYTCGGSSGGGSLYVPVSIFQQMTASGARGCFACHGRISPRRWFRCWRKFTHSGFVLRYILSEAFS